MPKCSACRSDAITRDTQANAPNDRTSGAATSTSEPKGQGLEYAARVSLARTDMQVDERLVKLGPGMAVTVEIKTGSRRIISYLLSPPAKYGGRPCGSVSRNSSFTRRALQPLHHEADVEALLRIHSREATRHHALGRANASETSL